MGETALVGAPPATEVATVRGFTKRYGKRVAADAPLLTEVAR